MVTQALSEAYPNAKCSLHYKTPYELLIATILSAQCTDHRIIWWFGCLAKIHFPIMLKNSALVSADFLNWPSIAEVDA